MKRVCIVPQVSGVGGMVSFRAKFSAGLKARGIEVVNTAGLSSFDSLLVIGGTADLPPGVKAEFREWNEAREIEDLHDMDIGIMPLPDTPWERGKCGFKLIQYMACRLPVVASPVGVNSKIVEHGVDGYLARDDSEWLAAFGSLASDASLRKSFGQAGRRKVAAEYSLQVTAPRMVELVRSCARK